MKFAKVINGVIEGYKEFPSQPECKYINGLPTIRPVNELAKPAYNVDTHGLSRTETIFPDRVEWSYAAVALPPEQVTTIAEAQAAAADKASVKAESQVQAFIAMTPAQVNTYIDAQVTDLASVKQVLKFFGRMLLILVRREYR